MGFIVALFVFLFITVPSIVFSVSAWIWTLLLLPIRLLIGKHYAIRVFIPFLYKFIFPISLILGVPLVLYFYVWELLGWIFFAWMIIYFVSRRFSGVHDLAMRSIEAMKGLDDLEQKMKRKQ